MAFTDNLETFSHYFRFTFFLKTINNDIIYFNYQIEIDIEPTDKVNIKVQLVASGTGFLWIRELNIKEQP